MMRYTNLHTDTDIVYVVTSVAKLNMPYNILIIFIPGKPLVAQKLQNESYKMCSVVHPTLAGRHYYY